MLKADDKKLIERGLEVADLKMYQEDKIWSRYSNDKVDIGEELAGVIRTLFKAEPLSKKLRCLSIGSSDEPQFRILETAFRGGLYLLDIDSDALDLIRERVIRQRTDHVYTLRRDYKKNFLNEERAKDLLRRSLHGKRTDLVTMHHSLYYCDEKDWGDIAVNLYRHILSRRGAMHFVLMAANSDVRESTSWLYEHFVGKYFGLKNHQSLRQFAKDIGGNRVFGNARIKLRTNKVYFYVDDFEKFMAVVWMIMLYPDVHSYTLAQKEEITEYVYKRIWKKKRPLVQFQDHLAVFRGVVP